MIPEVLLICALALPAWTHSWPRIVSWHMAGNEKDRIVDWIRKHNPGAHVFVHPNPPRKALRKHGWERAPFTWKGEKIWIKRPPPKQHMLGTSA